MKEAAAASRRAERTARRGGSRSRRGREAREAPAATCDDARLRSIWIDAFDGNTGVIPALDNFRARGTATPTSAEWKTSTAVADPSER